MRANDTRGLRRGHGSRAYRLPWPTRVSPAGSNKRTLTHAEFRTLFTDMGIADREDIDDLLSLFTRRTHGSITREDAAAVALALGSTGSPEERFMCVTWQRCVPCVARALTRVLRGVAVRRALFAACDTANTGFIDYNMLNRAVYALVRLREVLFKRQLAQDEARRALTAVTRTVATSPATATVDTAAYSARRRARMRLLRARNPNWRHLKSLDQVLRAEAAMLAHMMLAEGDVGVGKKADGLGNGRLSQAEFEQWVYRPDSGSGTAALLDLFAVFTTDAAPSPPAPVAVKRDGDSDSAMASRGAAPSLQGSS